ncbi:MAG: transglycosylase SLT domain-containing protein, partial [Gemmatimonadales bacterium]
ESGDTLALARAELALRRPERALALLEPALDAAPSAVHLELSARAAYEMGEFARAAALFSRAVPHHTGSRRGTLAARAGDAFERAGLDDSAAAYYREAGRRLAPIAGWLALREARVTDEPVRAFDLLRSAPPEARAMAARIRAPLLLAANDTARALGALREAGAHGEAARLAVMLGDGGAARASLRRSLADESPEGLQPLIAFLDSASWPSGAPHGNADLARAYRSVGRPEEAVTLLQNALGGPSDTVRTLRLLGDVMVETGRLRQAEAYYTRAAAAAAGADAALAAYRRADVLGRLGRTAARWEALAEFTRGHPGHWATPRTLFQLGERLRGRGELGRADSVMRILQAQWPDHAYGSRARLALAGFALARGDTSGALEWYGAEVTAEGASQHAARFFRAQLERALGDQASARALYQDVARRDSLGYYGAIAHEVMGLAAPAGVPPREPPRDARSAALLQRLDLLVAAGFRAEAEAVVAFHTQRGADGIVTQLAFGRGLVGRGWVAEAIRLGWRLADSLSLHDARVLRLIYPWPLQALIRREAAEHGLDPYLLAGLIRQESAFRPDVTSRAGARGLMQLMPATAAWLAGRLGVEWDDRFLAVADANLHLGAVHLASLLDAYDGDVVLALAAYNAGGTPVNRWRRLPEARDPYRLVERIPYVETRGFVQSVIRNQHIYRMLYPAGADTP